MGENIKLGQTVQVLNLRDKLDEDWTMFRYIMKLAWSKVDAAQITQDQLSTDKAGNPRKLRVGMGFSMYGEINRLQPNISESPLGHPSGEDALRQKVEQLDDNFAWNENLQWELYAVDDSGDPYKPKHENPDSITDIAKIDEIIMEFAEQSRLASEEDRKIETDYLILRVPEDVMKDEKKILEIREKAKATLLNIGEKLDEQFDVRVQEAKIEFDRLDKKFKEVNKRVDFILSITGIPGSIAMVIANLKPVVWITSKISGFIATGIITGLDIIKSILILIADLPVISTIITFITGIILFLAKITGITLLFSGIADVLSGIKGLSAIVSATGIAGIMGKIFGFLLHLDAMTLTIIGVSGLLIYLFPYIFGAKRKSFETETFKKGDIDLNKLSKALAKKHKVNTLVLKKLGMKADELAGLTEEQALEALNYVLVNEDLYIAADIEDEKLRQAICSIQIRAKENTEFGGKLTPKDLLLLNRSLLQKHFGAVLQPSMNLKELRDEAEFDLQNAENAKAKNIDEIRRIPKDGITLTIIAGDTPFLTDPAECAAQEGPPILFTNDACSSGRVMDNIKKQILLEHPTQAERYKKQINVEYFTDRLRSRGYTAKQAQESKKGGGVKESMQWQVEQGVDLVCSTDLDTSVNLSFTGSLIKPHFDSGTEMLGLTYGSRVGRESVVYGKPFTRKVMSAAFNTMVRMILSIGSIPDTQCGFKCFKPEVVQKVIELSSSIRMEFETEVQTLTILSGHKVRGIEIPWVDSAKESTVAAGRDSAEFLLAAVEQRLLHMTGHDISQYEHSFLDSAAKFRFATLMMIVDGMILSFKFPDLTKKYWALLSEDGRVPEGLVGKIGLALGYRKSPIFKQAAAVRYVQRKLKLQEAYFPAALNPFAVDLSSVNADIRREKIDFSDIRDDFLQALRRDGNITNAMSDAIINKLDGQPADVPAEFMRIVQEMVYRTKVLYFLVAETGLSINEAENVIDMAVEFDYSDVRKLKKALITLGQDFGAISKLNTFNLSDNTGLEAILMRLQNIDAKRRGKQGFSEEVVQSVIDAYYAEQTNLQVQLDYSEKARNSDQVKTLAAKFLNEIQGDDRGQLMSLENEIARLAGLDSIEAQELHALEERITEIANPGLLIFAISAVAYLETPQKQVNVVNQVRKAVVAAVMAHSQYGQISELVDQQFVVANTPEAGGLMIRPAEYQAEGFFEGTAITLADVQGVDADKPRQTVAALLNKLNTGRQTKLNDIETQKAGVNLAKTAIAMIKGKDSRVYKPSQMQRLAENQAIAFIGSILVGAGFLVFGVHIITFSIIAIFSLTVGWFLAYGVTRSKTRGWIMALLAAVFAFAITYGAFFHIILAIIELNLAQVLTGLAWIIFLNITSVTVGKITKNLLWNKGMLGKVSTIGMVIVGLYFGDWVFQLLNGGLWFQGLAQIGPIFKFGPVITMFDVNWGPFFQLGWINILFGPVIGLLLGLVKLMTLERSKGRQQPLRQRVLSIAKQAVILIVVPIGGFFNWLIQMYYRLQGQKQPLRQDMDSWLDSEIFLVDHAALRNENGQLSSQGMAILKTANEYMYDRGYENIELKGVESLGPGLIGSVAALFSLEEIQQQAAAGQNRLAAIRITRTGVKSGAVAMDGADGTVDFTQQVQTYAESRESQLDRQAAFVVSRIEHMFSQAEAEFLINAVGITFDNGMDSAGKMVFMQMVRDQLAAKGLEVVDIRWGDASRLDAQTEIRVNNFTREKIGYLALEQEGMHARLFKRQTADIFFEKARVFMQGLKYGDRAKETPAQTEATETPEIYTPRAFLNQAAVSTAVASFPRFLPFIGKRLGSGILAKAVTFMIMAPYALYMAFFMNTKKVELMATGDQLQVAKWLSLDVAAYHVPFRERTADIHPVMERQYADRVDVVFHTYEWEKYISFYMSEKGITDRSAAEMALLSQASRNNICINLETVFAREEAQSLGLSDKDYVIAANQVAVAEKLMQEKIEMVKLLRARWQTENKGKQIPVKIVFDPWHISEIYFAELEQAKQSGKDVKDVRKKLAGKLQRFFDQAGDMVGRLHISNTPYNMLGAGEFLTHGLSVFDRNSIIDINGFLSYANEKIPGIWQNATLEVNPCYGLVKQPLLVKVFLALAVPALILGVLIKAAVLSPAAAGKAYGIGALSTNIRIGIVRIFKYIFFNDEAEGIRVANREAETKRAEYQADTQSTYASVIDYLDTVLESNKTNRENILMTLLLTPSADQISRDLKIDNLVSLLEKETKLSVISRILLDLQFAEVSWVKSSGYEAAVLERIKQAIFNNPVYQKYLQPQNLAAAQTPREFKERFEAGWRERLRKQQISLGELTQTIKSVQAQNIEENVSAFQNIIAQLEIIAKVDINGLDGDEYQQVQ